MLEDDYFFNTIENIEEDTTLSRYQQDRAINKLVKLGLIEYQVKGMPARRYFKINYDDTIEKLLCKKLTNYFVRNSQTTLQQTDKLLCKKLTSNNTNTNNTKNNTNTNINIMVKEDLNDKAKEVFEYWQNTLNHKKAKYSQDKARKIKARIKEGFTVEECKEAIDGCAKSPFHNGQNNDKKKYHSIDLIFRNASKLEWFISLGKKSTNKVKSIKEYAKEFDFDMSEV